MTTPIEPTEPMDDIEKVRQQLSTLLDPEFSRLIVSAVAGTRVSNSRYHCAIYTAEKISLIEKTKNKSSTCEFNFNTQQFDSNSDDSPQSLGTFTQKLMELLEKAHAGKATILKKH
jgi:hypothetical protein